MKKPKYHGWIYIQKAEGHNDSIYASVSNHDNVLVPGDRPGSWLANGKQKFCGHGADGAAVAVDLFETFLKLGPIKLLPTPLGLRVYTEDAEDPEVDEEFCEDCHRRMSKCVCSESNEEKPAKKKVEAALVVEAEESQAFVDIEARRVKLVILLKKKIMITDIEHEKRSIRFKWLGREFRVSLLSRADLGLPFLVEESVGGSLVSNKETETVEQLIKENYKEGGD
jgi:hypothetical protein